jgi:hypothetical protein
MAALALIKNPLRLSKPPLLPIRTIHIPVRVHERILTICYRDVLSGLRE